MCETCVIVYTLSVACMPVIPSLLDWFCILFGDP